MPMIKISQNKTEMDMFKKFLTSRFPSGIRSYLEIGSYAGESLEYMSEVFSLEECFVTLVDLEVNRKARDKLLEVRDRLFDEDKVFAIRILDGDSTDKEIISAVQKDRYDVGFIDGNHDFSYVYSDYVNYGPLCSYVGFHDINPRCMKRQVQKHGIEKACAAHLWAGLKQDSKYKTYEFIDDSAPMVAGIGVVERRV